MRREDAKNLKPNETVKLKATGTVIVVKGATEFPDGVDVEDLLTGRHYRHTELTK